MIQYAPTNVLLRSVHRIPVRAVVEAVLVVQLQALGRELFRFALVDLDPFEVADVLDVGAAGEADGFGAGFAFVDGAAVNGVEAWVFGVVGHGVVFVVPG